jgi:hypothetical protein
MMINLSALSNQQLWLLIALLYVCACAESGQAYEHDHPNNTAVQGVNLADSIYGAYLARFPAMVNTSGGSAGPQPTHENHTSSPMPSVVELMDQISQRAGIPTPPPSAQPPRPAAPRK